MTARKIVMKSNAFEVKITVNTSISPFDAMREFLFNGLSESIKRLRTAASPHQKFAQR